MPQEQSLVKVTLKTPVSEDLFVSISHQGDYRRFQSTASASYGSQNINGQFDFHSVPKIAGKATLSGSIFSEEIVLSFNHDGVLSHAFESHARAAYGRQAIVASVEFSTGRQISGKATLSAPFFSEEIAMSFNHNGALSNFQSTATVTYGRQNINGNVEFAAGDQITLKATLATPFTDEVILSFNHNGALSNFQTFATATYGHQVINTHVEFSAGHQITGKATLTTPFTNDIEVTINHQGRLSAFRSSASAAYGRQTINGNVEFSQMNGKVILTTPFTEDISLSFNHDGDLTTFQSSALAVYGSQQVQVTAQFDGVSGTVSLRTPMTQSMSLNFKHSGNSESFDTTVTGQYGRDQVCCFILLASSIED